MNSKFIIPSLRRKYRPSPTNCEFARFHFSGNRTFFLEIKVDARINPRFHQVGLVEVSGFIVIASNTLVFFRCIIGTTTKTSNQIHKAVTVLPDRQPA
ncbi:hypothetical protein EBX93_15250 [bacterium]|nr:hypothetical protein [bacterium]